jgi:hypothetical protein
MISSYVRRWSRRNDVCLQARSVDLLYGLSPSWICRPDNQTNIKYQAMPSGRGQCLAPYLGLMLDSIGIIIRKDVVPTSSRSTILYRIT